MQVSINQYSLGGHMTALQMPMFNGQPKNDFIMILIATPDQMYGHDANGLPLDS